MPRRPWRSLNAFSASPIRVPLDQSGAAAAARWIARSGLRDGERAGEAREPRGEHERLGVRARCRRRTSGTAGRRARTAPSSRRCRTASRAGGGTTRRRRRARRIGSPPVRRLARSVRRRSIALAVAAALVAARAPHAASPARAATSAGRAARARAARARRSACSRAAPRRSPSRAAPRPRLAVLVVVAGAGAAATAGARAGSPASAASRLGAALVVRRRDGRDLVGLEAARVARAIAEDREEDRVERAAPAAVGDEHGARASSTAAAG